jgi:hypothetical protein
LFLYLEEGVIDRVFEEKLKVGELSIVITTQSSKQ